MPNASSIYFTAFLACQNHICANDGNKYLTLDTHNLSTTKTNDGKPWMYFVCVCVCVCMCVCVVDHHLQFTFQNERITVVCSHSCCNSLSWQTFGYKMSSLHLNQTVKEVNI